MPCAIIQICLTSLFLFGAIILKHNQTLDGSYAILCSVARLFYQLQLRHNGNYSKGSLPQHENGAKIDSAPSASCL